uniref:Uncharacterized protein n=1 Tax=viral metagenome TaxID=1070528 RepID=A0A6C0H8Z1_9ZZZZ
MNTNDEAIIEKIKESINSTTDKWSSASTIRKFLYKIKKKNTDSDFIEFIFNYYKNCFEEVCNIIDKIDNSEQKFLKITTLPGTMQGVIFIWQWLIKADEIYEGLPNINKYFQTINMSENKRWETRSLIRHASSFAESSVPKKIKIS